MCRFVLFITLTFLSTMSWASKVENPTIESMPKKGQRGRSKVLSLDNSKLMLESGDIEKLTCYRK
ncbi:hypothetical protein JV59_33670 [Vibrio coralliilyticus]|nr:hypothetical protein JV59_33670 [Vibrio coralliilyticus]